MVIIPYKSSGLQVLKLICCYPVTCQWKYPLQLLYPIYKKLGEDNN